MPIKKSTTVKAQAKPVSKPKASAKSVVSNEALRAEIAALKKQIESLSSQCHSCCADLKALKSQKSDDKDDRLDRILDVIKEERDYKALRKFVNLKL